MMSKDRQTDREDGRISRRSFFRAGGAALAGGAILGTPTEANATAEGSDGLFPSPTSGGRIMGYHRLGRTGWQVSDYGVGTSRLRESSVIRYAFDKGINYIDTAEGYGNTQTERTIGEALQHIDRSKVFLNTKLRVGSEDTEETILRRARASLERLNTDYLDAFGMHGPDTIEGVRHPGFHAAVARLKAEGRVRHACLSYHGPQGPRGDSMADVLCAAAEDGRFDLMLLVYNFMNHEEADRILAACKANDVGTTAMKTAPGVLSYDPVDASNLTDAQQRSIERMVARGSSRERAIEQLQAQAERQKDLYERTRAFADRYGVQTGEQLRLASFHWAIQSPDMHCACVSMPDFAMVDNVVARSGTELRPVEQDLLEEFGAVLNDRYCRHGCAVCVPSCPNGVPVSTIMRYAYYYEGQGREKYAMSRYAGLGGTSAVACVDCSAPCSGACPHGIDIQPQMEQAHALLTLA
jgi:predicted aldo/keto reductase-like oxidoreductase